MPVRKYKPTSPGRRFQDVLTREEITAERPEKALTRGMSKSGGRNNRGRITTYQRGGGHKRRYRAVDFRREKTGVPGKVRSIEYDPNRSARLALIVYLDGEKRYILAPDGLEVGDAVSSGPEAEKCQSNVVHTSLVFQHLMGFVLFSTSDIGRCCVGTA